MEYVQRATVVTSLDKIVTTRGDMRVDSRIQNKRTKKHNLQYPQHLPQRRQDCSDVSGGGSSVRRRLGQQWPRPVGLRSQGEASFFLVAKNQFNSMERRSGGLQIVGGESLCTCNVKAWGICDEGGEGCCSNQWLLYLVL